MSSIVPFVAPSLAPEQDRRQAAARPRTGRHEPLRSTTTRIAARGAAFGATVAAGTAGAAWWARHDPALSLLAGAQLGSVAAAMAFAGAWAERRRMTRVAGRISDLAVRLAAEEPFDQEAVPRLLAVRSAHAPELAAATRRLLARGGERRALRLLGRVALIRTLL